MSRLKGLSVYLSGPCENASDSGVSWRKELTPFLRDELELTVLDPTNKLFKLSFSNNNEDEFKIVKELREKENYEKLAECMKEVVAVDLRMTDLSSLIICQLDATQPTYGTIDEIVIASTQKKPIYLYCKQGKKFIPLWLWGRIPSKYIFNNIEEIKEKLLNIKNCKSEDLHKYIDKRWLFPNGVE